MPTFRPCKDLGSTLSSRRLRAGVHQTGLASTHAPSLRPEKIIVAGILIAVFVSFVPRHARAVGDDPIRATNTRPPWTTGRVVGSPNPPSPFTVRRLVPHLRFENPVDFARLPGTDRWLVADQAGRFWSFRDPATAPEPRLEPVIDLRRVRLAGAVDNVLAFAFHPGFATNRFVFVNYNEAGDRPDGSHVARFTFSSLEPPRLDPDSEVTILRWFAGGHNGCTLAFGNDGMLYVSTGDGASPDPPDGVFRTGQDLSDLLAAVLRIDVDHPAPGKTYAIPPDNPFVDRPGARPEIWAFGFRNPFRMSIDPATGDLWVGDVGWEQWEMIYRVRRGGNYGWPITEGPNRHVRSDVTPGPGPILPALVALPHSEAASITAGRVYRGRRHSRLQGAFLYGDWETGKFWALRHERDGDLDRLVANEELCDTTLKPVAFAEDRDGEPWILDYGGGLHTFEPNPAPPANLAFPRRLGETGLFADTARRIPAPGVVPYRPKAPMWSDAAEAERLVAIPGNAAISPTGGRETIVGRMWFYPSNTVFARTLTLPIGATPAPERRPVETQLLHFDGQTWNAYTYRWRSDHTDADLVPAEGTNTVLNVVDARAPDGRSEMPWRFLGRAECFRCHNVWAGDLLSFNPLQLGTADDARSDSEARRLARLGVLELDSYPEPRTVLVDPYDPSQDLDRRARSWLHVNCAGCHRFGAGGGVNLYLDFDRRLRELRLVDQKPTRGDFGIHAARLIAGGEPERSVLFHRINTEGTARMPHIGSRRADPAGVSLVGRWIRSLDPTTDTGAEVLAARRLADETARALDSVTQPASPSDPPTTLPSPTRDLAAILDRALASMNGALLLLDRLNGGDAPALASLHQAAAVVSRTHTNALIRDLLQRLLPPSERRSTLGTDFPPETVLAIAGDALRGQALFTGAAQCSNCHVRDGIGRAFGPDLGAVARKYSRAQLLDQIVRPSASVAPEYRLVTLELRNGEELQGFVRRRTATNLVLEDAQLEKHAVLLDGIRESRESTLSAMPEGLLSTLTAEEAADLLEYLSVPPH